MTNVKTSGGGRGYRGAMDKLKVHALLSVLTFVVGGMLMTYMIYVESEPGAIPLLLVVLGIGWYSITRVRIRSRRK